MECDLHVVSITGLLLLCDEFGGHGKHSSDNLSAGSCYLHVFLLCAMPGSQLDEMHPGSQGAVHVEPAHSETFGEDRTSLFFRYAIFARPFIGITHGKQHPFLCSLPLDLQQVIVCRYRVLSVTIVLEPCFSQNEIEFLSRVSISLAELLEGE
jgi:hypothetical protein